MEYPQLNYTSQSFPSDQTLIEVFHALALPGERQQLPPASVVLVQGQVMALAKVAKQLWDILAVGEGVLQGGRCVPSAPDRISVPQVV